MGVPSETAFHNKSRVLRHFLLSLTQEGPGNFVSISALGIGEFN